MSVDVVNEIEVIEITEEPPKPCQMQRRNHLEDVREAVWRHEGKCPQCHSGWSTALCDPCLSKYIRPMYCNRCKFEGTAEDFSVTVWPL